MDIGFETIGNATLIVHDRRPILVTDPWLKGTAYFGSWKLSHHVPPQQLQAATAAEYAWFSHGHPDHLNHDTLPLFEGTKILLPHHQGNRILTDLSLLGFQVKVLPDRQWVTLSPRVRVMCIPDYNQDAVLLLDINGRLVFNQNDAGPRGWGDFVKSVLRQARVSYMLALAGYGDADLMNYFDESGRRLPPLSSSRVPLGGTVSVRADEFGATFFIPFSAMHRFGRTDSAWAAEHSATLDDWKNGWNSTRCELLPAFVRVDCERERVEEIRPPETDPTLLPPAAFGDHWEERLERDDARLLTAYFRRVEKLKTVMDFLTFRVGGQDHTLTLNSPGTFKKGLTIEAPRASLMRCVRERIFDDLLIGNFAKVTLHGDWGRLRLYPDFTPWVAKYGDNGNAYSFEQLGRYFAAYRSRDPLGYLRHRLEANVVLPLQEATADFLRSRLGQNNAVFLAAKRTYRSLRGRA